MLATKKVAASAGAATWSAPVDSPESGEAGVSGAVPGAPAQEIFGLVAMVAGREIAVGIVSRPIATFA